MKKKIKRKNRLVRILTRFLLGILIFFTLLILFIRSPWGQNIIVQQAVSYVSGKTNTTIEIKKLYLTFSGNIYLEGLYLEDTAGDTLIYSDKLEANIAILPIVRGKGITIHKIDWTGLKANIYRKDSTAGFNFQFLIDAFASEEPPKEETSNVPSNLSIGSINLTDFKISFIDEVSGINTHLLLGELDIKVKEIDLETMRFHVAQAHLNHSSITYLQTLTSSATETTNTQETTLPYIIVEDVQLNSVWANYNSVPEGLTAIADIKSFRLELPKADIAHKDIEVNHIGLFDSDFRVQTTTLNPIEDTAEEMVEVIETPKEFTLPDWTVVVNEIRLENNTLGYAVDKATPTPGRLNTNAIEVNSLNFSANEFRMKYNTLTVELKSLQLTEASGINIKSIGLDLDFNQEELSVSNLDVKINDNILQGDFRLGYPSINQVIHNPELATLNVSLTHIQLSVADAFLVAPQLQHQEQLLLLSQHNLNGKLSVRGKVANLQTQIDLGWRNTYLRARGSVQEVLDTQRMTLNFPDLFLQTHKTDLSLFINDKEAGINIPEEVKLSANARGRINDLSAQALLETSLGNLAIEGDFTTTQSIAFETDLRIENLEVGTLLKNNKLGILDFELQASGNGKDLNHLDAQLDARIKRFGFNDYAITDWQVLGELHNGEGTLTTAYKDENIDVALNTFIALDTLRSHLRANLDLKGINLKAVGITETDIRSGFALHADFKGNTDDFNFVSQITDGIIRKDNQTYLLGDFDIIAQINKDSTFIDITNKMIETTLHSNAHPKEFPEAFKHHFEHYLSDSLLVHTDSIQRPIELQLQLKIAEAPLLNEVFLEGLERMDTIRVSLDFDQRIEKLSANLQLPYLNYNGNILDSLMFVLDSDHKQLDFDLGFASLEAGPLAIKQTHLLGNLQNNLLLLDFASYYEEKQILNVQSALAISNDTLQLSLNPEQLILNSAPWQVPERNRITYANKHVSFQDFKLSNQNRSLEITHQNPNIEKEHIEVIFNNFSLADLLNYLNPEETLAEGELNGDLVIVEPFQDVGLLASLEISNLKALEVPLGQLELNAQAIESNVYNFNLGLSDGDIDLNLEGNYSADQTPPSFGLDLQLNQIKLKALEQLSQGEITNAQGSLSGEFHINGTTAQPQYQGNITFEEVGFSVKKLNAEFNIDNQTILADNTRLNFNKFSIGDQNNNTFVVDGAIHTSNLSNPEFELVIAAKDFSVLNSTREDNDLFYGTANFDIDATLSGSLSLPQIRMRLDLHPSTDITYIMAESEVQVEEREGVVVFINKANPDDILTQTQQEQAYRVSGVDVKALIAIEREATFTIVINEQTGDNLKISGEGDLNLDIDPNGRINLAGRYEMTSGHFEMNLYNLVKRRFEVVEGSSVSWAGDPMDASLDIQSIYKVETSASALMAAQTSGMDASEAGRFKQRLPFLVYLNIGGEIMQPDLSFNIDMPEDERGAIGGQVYSRIRQIDQQEDERNRQVFSLLVLNRFFPDSGSDGSGGGAMAMARNSLNQALSDQLNNLSDQLLGKAGVELDFGLNSYTDYQGNAPQDRTQLDITAQKKLFDDRLILSVGSEVDIEGSNQTGENTPVIGNVAIEYLITEDGRFRLKGFRKNQYENVIDGQIFVNGIALIFSKEFNKYKELWKKEVTEQSENNTDKHESEK